MGEVVIIGTGIRVIDIETPEYQKNDWNRPGNLDTSSPGRT